MVKMIRHNGRLWNTEDFISAWDHILTLRERNRIRDMKRGQWLHFIPTGHVIVCECG